MELYPERHDQLLDLPEPIRLPAGVSIEAGVTDGTAHRGGGIRLGSVLPLLEVFLDSLQHVQEPLGHLRQANGQRDAVPPHGLRDVPHLAQGRALACQAVLLQDLPDLLHADLQIGMVADKLGLAGVDEEPPQHDGVQVLPEPDGGVEQLQASVVVGDERVQVPRDHRDEERLAHRRQLLLQRLRDGREQGRLRVAAAEALDALGDL
mmetsp:Transcript_18346/g.51988  ORF Transcript_18346/g.51988 Transcript_18346/m.51988 type:complete len:207 (-) Transcript_18346:221-841(-)